MSTFLIDGKFFNPTDTFECGQIFRYKKSAEGAYTVASRDKFAVVKKSECGYSVTTDDEEYFKNFFDLTADYGKIIEELSCKKEVMKRATAFGSGIRILKQDLYETIISFIISANNNIKRIQLIIERLCAALGKKTEYGFAFPEPKVMADKNEEFFAGIGAGYRAAYLAETAKKLYDGFDFDELKKSDTATARKILLSLKGIGPKVADCILLFGMHRGDVFPVDTWIKKVYHAEFETGLADSKISDYFVNLFGENAGIAQQYLFYFFRIIDK